MNLLEVDPAAGVSVVGGLFKMRLARRDGCKSGGWRVLHLSRRKATPAFLLSVFGKNEKASIPAAERAELAAICDLIAADLWEMAMSGAYESVRRGLEEALAYAEGRRDGAVTHEVPAPEPDVAAIRARSGLSQPASPGASAWRSALCVAGSRVVGGPKVRRGCCWR